MQVREAGRERERPNCVPMCPSSGQFGRQFLPPFGDMAKLRPDASVGDQVGVIDAVAVERGQRPLEERCGDRRPHVDAGVEQFGGDFRAAFGNVVEPRP